jgi:hypothetical protein
MALECAAAYARVGIIVGGFVLTLGGEDALVGARVLMRVIMVSARRTAGRVPRTVPRGRAALTSCSRSRSG